MSPITMRLSFSYNIPGSIIPTPLQATAWNTNIKGSANKLLTNLRAIVPDTTAYNENIVTPAVQNWANFVNPAFVSKKGQTAATITKKMSARLRESADKYLNGIQQIFGNDGALYKAAIDAKQANWAKPLGGVASYVLPVSGSRATGFQAVPFALHALTGKSKAMRMLGENMIKGSIVNIVTPGLESAFRAAMSGVLFQLYADFYHNLQTPDEINGKIATLANNFANPAVCNTFAWPVVPESSALYYARGGGNNQLCCQIVFGTP